MTQSFELYKVLEMTIKNGKHGTGASRGQVFGWRKLNHYDHYTDDDDDIQVSWHLLSLQL